MLSYLFDLRPGFLGCSANRCSCVAVIEKFLPIRSPSLPCRQYLRISDSSTPRTLAASAVVYLIVMLFLGEFVASTFKAGAIGGRGNPKLTVVAKHNPKALGSVVRGLIGKVQAAIHIDPNFAAFNRDLHRMAPCGGSFVPQ